MIRTLFPLQVEVVEGADPLAGGPLHPDESACIERAVPKRRREFTAGRSCARTALARFGVEDFPLVPDTDRVPVWPPGFVGSLSHCDGYCAAAVARCEDARSLGIDVERQRRVDAALVRRICTDAELRAAAEGPQLAGELAALAIFSARESVYKCYYPIARTLLEHRDLEIRLGSGGRYTARLTRETLPSAAGARRFEGRIAIDAHFVYTGVMLA